MIRLDCDAHPRTAHTWKPDGRRKRERSLETRRRKFKRERAQILDGYRGGSSRQGTLVETVLPIQFSWVTDRNQMIIFNENNQKIFLKARSNGSNMLVKRYLRNKICFPCLHSLVKTEANVWENSRADNILDNSVKLFRGFYQAMKARITCFISFIELLFFVLTKRKTIYEACMYTIISFMKL